MMFRMLWREAVVPQLMCLPTAGLSLFDISQIMSNFICEEGKVDKRR